MTSNANLAKGNDRPTSERDQAKLSTEAMDPQQAATVIQGYYRAHKSRETTRGKNNLHHSAG